MNARWAENRRSIGEVHIFVEMEVPFALQLRRSVQPFAFVAVHREVRKRDEGFDQLWRPERTK
jgi:hypothetical protein